MKPALASLLLLVPLAALHADTSKLEAGGGFATASQLEEFLGEPLFVPMQRVWEKRAGTPSQGKIYLLFEGGPKSWDEAVQLAVFNLGWLLDGRDIAPFLHTAP